MNNKDWWEDWGKSVQPV